MVLKDHFADRHEVLEVGSGTGQHAAYFSAALRHLIWQASDRKDYLHGIGQWLLEAQRHDLPPPMELDVNGSWPKKQFDAVFSANTFHIMSFEEVEKFFKGIDQCLGPDGKLILYGPFNYQGQYTSDSNAQFDATLKRHNRLQGIRNFEDIDNLAHGIGLELSEDRPMPANNHCLVYQRVGEIQGN
jgi:SAM-dependent methyltransferase